MTVGFPVTSGGAELGDGVYERLDSVEAKEHLEIPVLGVHAFLSLSLSMASAILYENLHQSSIQELATPSNLIPSGQLESTPCIALAAK